MSDQETASESYECAGTVHEHAPRLPPGDQAEGKAIKCSQEQAYQDRRELHLSGLYLLQEYRRQQLARRCRLLELGQELLLAVAAQVRPSLDRLVR